MKKYLNVTGFICLNIFIGVSGFAQDGSHSEKGGEVRTIILDPYVVSGRK